jgi:hypothetical protein
MQTVLAYVWGDIDMTQIYTIQRLLVLWSDTANGHDVKAGRPKKGDTAATSPAGRHKTTSRTSHRAPATERTR